MPQKSELTSSFFASNALFILEENSLSIIDINEYAIEFYGYSREVLCGMSVKDLGSKIPCPDHVDASNQSGELPDQIWLHKTASGSEKYVHFTWHFFTYRGKPARIAIAHDITRQINGDAEMAQIIWSGNDDLYRDTHLEAEIIWDHNLCVQSWSDEAKKLFGWQRKDTVGNIEFINQFIPKVQVEGFRQTLAGKAMHGECRYSFDQKVITKAGETVNCDWQNRLVYDNGELATVESQLFFKKSNEELERLFRTLSERSLVGAYLIQDNIFKYVNPRLAQIFGYSTDEIENKRGPMDLVYPDDRSLVAKNLKKRLQNSVDALEYDFRCVKKDGSIIFVKVFGRRIQFKGKPAVAGTLLDITQHKLAFKRYQASVESFEDLFDSVSDAIYIQDEERKFIKVNDAAVELNGFSRDELIGRTNDFLLASGKVDLDQNIEYFKEAMRGNPQKFEHWGIRKNGEVFPEEVVLNPGTYFGKDVVIAISRDISDRYEVEGEIEESREKFHQLFENAPFGIAMMDSHQEIKTVNSAFEDIFGFKEKEVRNINIDRLIIPETFEESAEELTQLNMEGKTFAVTSSRKRKDGSPVEVLIYGVPVIVKEKAVAFFGIYVDITERKKAEEKVKKSLKEKEVLLAEIHHRVKNNLAVITGLLELQLHNTEMEEARNVLRESQLRINSIALIHEKLYQNENFSQISIDVYLDELIGIISSSMGDDKTEVNISVEAQAVSMTITQAIPCGLILNELITNSYKHAFSGRENGAITIIVEEKEGSILLTYLDDGKGLPESLDVENPSSLGITLIKTLCRQLQGEFSFNNLSDGLQFSLSFDIEIPSV